MDLRAEMLERNENTLVSSYCHIAHNSELEAILKEQYGRSGLCLKIFPAKWDKPEDVTWGMVSLRGCTIIQNLFAMHDLAPRIYDLVWINSEQIAQVTNFLKDNGHEPDERKLLALVKDYGIEYLKHVDTAPRNWVGNRYVDFGGMFFTDWGKYEEDLMARAHTRRGENIDSAYQIVEELSIHGQRDMVYRSAMMCLDEVDFRGKTVLDMGCNLGVFCQDAHSRGAQRIFGIDRRDLPGLAREIANAQGYWNLNFLSLDLQKGDNRDCIRQATGADRFDIVYFMAIANYVGGYAPWVADLCQDVLYIEGHGGERPRPYKTLLEKDFRSVEFMGMTKDNYRRPLFRCRKH